MSDAQIPTRDEAFAEILAQDYLHPRRIPTGQWLAMQRQLYTWGLSSPQNE